MYCSNCGTQIPDESNFCLNCGKPQKADVVPFQPKYEFCEIVYVCVKQGGIFFDPLDKLQFWAKATGETGNYDAGESDIFEGTRLGPNSSKNDAVDAHDGLVKKLLANGWERIETQGSEWYSFRFRRSQQPVTAK